MRLPDFEALAIFATVVEHRSFTGAGAALGMSKATISKAITRLEQRLGTILFHRTSRRLSLTDSGRILSERAAQILEDATQAEEIARDTARTPRGTIRMVAPMSFGLIHVGPVIADFLSHYPDINIDLNLSDDKTDIVEMGVDIALRIADLPDSSLRARRLGDVLIHIVAAPSYLEKYGEPQHPAQLGEHKCMSYAYLPNPDQWRFIGKDGEEVMVRLQWPLRCNSGEAMMPALRAGLGIGRLPGFIVDQDITSGALVPILTTWSQIPLGLHIITPPGQLRPARVELLIAFLTERIKKLCNLSLR